MDFLNGNAPLDVDKLAKMYTEILKTPMLSSAKVTTDDENVLTIYTEWSLDDMTNKDRTTIAKNYTVLKNSLDSKLAPLVWSTAPVVVNPKLSRFSSSGLKRAVVVTKKITNGDETEYLQIYDENGIIKTYDLKELDLHKAVYTGGPFVAFGNTLSWNPSETKIAYLAEMKIPKPKPFFTTYGSNKEDKSEQEKDGKGEEFAFRQTWGETISDCYQSVIVVLDTVTDQFKVIQLPDNAFPSDLQWKDDENLIGVALTNVRWRLGLVFCSNRDSRIFQINIDGARFKYLNEAGKSSMSPRVRPDGKYVVWQERCVLGPHEKARKIIGLNVDQDAVPTVIYEDNPTNQVPIYNNFPLNCWTSDGSKLFTVTTNDTEDVLLAFSSKNGVPSDPQVLRGITAVLSVSKDFLLVAKTRAAEPRSLHLLSFDLANSFNVTKSESILPFPLKRFIVQGAASPNSFYYGPAKAEPSTVPLVAFVHGGPHAVISDIFYCEMTFFMKLGFGVLHVNFVGSTGGKQDGTESLLGKIGDIDVDDCENILQNLLKQENSIDKNRIVFYGGSHSGFLGAHVSSRFPDTYKVVILRNPVVDVLALTAVSDITDWAFIESGVAVDTDVQPVIRTADDAKKFMTCSPIHNVDKVKAATLLLLGSEDLRVPMSQGLAYYRVLKAYNKEVDVRVYPDAHSLRKVPVRFDSFMHSLIWIFKHLK